jgi:hypothetical protein
VEGEATDFQHWKCLKAGEPSLGFPKWSDEEEHPPRHLQLPHHPHEEGNGREEEGQLEIPGHAESVDSLRLVRRSPRHEARKLSRLARREEVDLGRPPQGRHLKDDVGVQVPIRHQLKPGGRIRLEVLLRGDEDRKDLQTTGMKEKQNLLCHPEETTSPETSRLPDVGQRCCVVLHRMDVLQVDAGRISTRKIHKTEISFTLGENMHLNASLSLTPKAHCHIKMLLT